VLCAVSVRHEMPLLTTDKDFAAYARIVPLKLHRFAQA
jgi:hypothetical protein